MIPSLSLATGDSIPFLGIGTLQDPSKCSDAVCCALDIGYRHIDTATFYNNFNHLRSGIELSGVNRCDIFITSKVWHDSLSYKSIIKDCEKSLAHMELSYFNLYMIHRPNNNVPLNDTYRGLCELVSKGLIHNIGVSNFSINQLNEAISIFNKEPLSVIQDEFHPYYQDIEKIVFCKNNNIVFVSYSPFSNGQIFKDRNIEKISLLQGKEVSQVVLRWMYEKGIATIPMSSNYLHLRNNIDIFDFKLKGETVNLLNSLDKKRRARSY